MTRKEFINMCSLFGIGFSSQAMFSSCTKHGPKLNPFPGKVLIIGAGAGGLSAGYFLKQQGTDFEIIEASSAYGGRMKINTSFADFPIPLGSEWLETSTGIFQEIVNDSSIKVTVPTIADNLDKKFINYSWFNFFEDFLVPSIIDKISLHTIAQSIDYSGNQIVVRTNNGQFTADKVIVSVPLQILKNGDISFTPSLPKSKMEAINETVVWEGFKAFFEFSTNFYGDSEYIFPIIPESDGQKIYYNAAFGQNTTRNILGLFVVGAPARDFISREGEDLKNFILNELDSIYANQASPNYLQHLTQNWNNEPFIQGGYLSDHEDWRKVRDLGSSVADKLFFAGGEYTNGEDWVSVHTAARSSNSVIEEINN